MEEKDTNTEQVKKKVDESWKESVEKDKKTSKDNTAEQVSSQESPAQKPQDKPPMPEPDFAMFISGMGMQALMHLGELENPLTQKKEKDIVQAKYIIDILGLLQEKTKNNLSDQEEKLLEGLLYDLRMKYVSASKNNS